MARRIDPFFSIYTNIQQRSINISSDDGKVCRPLIIVHNGVAKITDSDVLGVKQFEDLVREGKVDTNEDNDGIIAVYDHGIKYDPLRSGCSDRIKKRLVGRLKISLSRQTQLFLNENPSHCLVLFLA